MSHCTGAPAEQLAEQYVAGTLPDPEAQAFEEHYFDCPVCLAQLQALQAAAEQIRRNPVRARARVIQWPVIVGAAGAIAAMLLIGFIGYRTLAHRSDAAKNPGPNASPAQKTEPPSSSSAISQLADLTLPPFAGSSLRGEEVNRNFAAGMKAYVAGDCASAVSELAHVPAESADAETAQFYSGVCQLKLNRLSDAASTLGGVAGKGDSPQQEAALYYLAQIALLRSDSGAARHDLERVISLHGDFEKRAKTELSKLPADASAN
jgi:TolA-binding protein